MGLGQVPDLSPSRGRALLPTQFFKLSIAPCSVKVFLEKAAFQAALLIVILFGDFLLPPNDAEKKKSPTEKHDSIFLTSMRVNSQQAGFFFFPKDFFSFFRTRHLQERQAEDSERGERMAAGGHCKTPRINITEGKQARDRYQAIRKSSGEWKT